MNALLTPRQRRAMVDVVIVEGWGVAATAERFQVDPKTVRKWRDRFVAEGPGGLVDRSSRPNRSPGRSSPSSSPQVRGTSISTYSHTVCSRLIPAGAGNMQRLSSVLCWHWAHPRRCGEHSHVR